MGADADDFFDEADEIEESARRLKRRLAVVGAVGIIALLIILVVLGFGVLNPSKDETPTPTPAPTAAPTSIPTPTSEPAQRAAATATPVPGATPTQTPRPTNTPRPAATATPTPAVNAVVLDDDVSLRPGATTWWFPRQRLPVGTELELIGYDSNFPDWVYVRTADGAAEGWVQVAVLQVNRDLDNLPHITPRPTLTSTPEAPGPTPMPAIACEGGPLRLDAWPVGYGCTSGGWTATIFVEGRGGDCWYTYAWEREVKGGPISGLMTFVVESADRDIAIVGEASVTSAGQTVVVGLYIPPPRCD